MHEVSIIATVQAWRIACRQSIGSVINSLYQKLSESWKIKFSTKNTMLHRNKLSQTGTLTTHRMAVKCSSALKGYSPWFSLYRWNSHQAKRQFLVSHTPLSTCAVFHTLSPTTRIIWRSTWRRINYSINASQ